MRSSVVLPRGAGVGQEILSVCPTECRPDRLRPRHSENQAALSFALALGAFLVAIFYLPAGGWIRAFLGLDVLYLTTSAFTLAKCVWDSQESRTATNRVDQARLEKLVAEHDPFVGAPLS